MKIKVRVMNPSGNITAFVKAKLEQEARPALADRLMQNEAMSIEQVGFLTEPQCGGLVRVEMMGGEFCGNALRCAGLNYALEHGIRGGAIIPVEISGCEHPVSVAVNTAVMEAKATMPLPRRSYQARINDIPAYVCDFDGIVHFVLSNEYLEQDNIDALLKYAVVTFHTGAVGLIFLSSDSEMIWPVVFVIKVGSLVFENSCASGTVAASIFRALYLKDGRHHIDWQQPGGVLNVDITKRQGEIEHIILGGKIGIDKDFEYDFDTENMNLSAEILKFDGNENN